MVKYPNDEEKLILPEDQQQPEYKYNAGNLNEKLVKKLNAAGIYVDPRCIINECKEIIPPLLGLTEVGIMIGWDRQKTAVYAKRKILPEPSVYIGDRAFWTTRQIEEWQQDEKNKKYLD